MRRALTIRRWKLEAVEKIPSTALTRLIYMYIYTRNFLDYFLSRFRFKHPPDQSVALSYEDDVVIHFFVNILIDLRFYYITFDISIWTFDSKFHRIKKMCSFVRNFSNRTERFRSLSVRLTSIVQFFAISKQTERPLCTPGLSDITIITQTLHCFDSPEWNKCDDGANYPCANGDIVCFETPQLKFSI